MGWLRSHKEKPCHSEQALFAQPGIWASRAMCRAFRDTIPARLASLLIALLCIAALFEAPHALASDAPADLLAAGHVDQVIQLLEQQVRSAPTGEAYNLLCRADFELDAWDAGISLCEKAVALAPDNGLYHLWLGRIYGEKADRVMFLKAAGLAGKVRTEFERAVKLSPDSWEARTDLAEFYLEAPGIVGGGEDKARAQADILMASNPGMAHWVRARIAQKNKDNDTADQEYHLAIDATHGGVRAWANLAGFYRHTNRLDEMQQALRTMESRPVDRPAALMDGASLLLRTGRDPALAIRLTRLYLASPTEEWPAFKAHNLLGELLEKQGDTQAAAEQFRSALALAHSFRPAQDGLKRLTH
jgi:tetratricopeptide (TPR) repeat protein